jgi:hypothetical protein
MTRASADEWSRPDPCQAALRRTVAGFTKIQDN